MSTVIETSGTASIGATAGKVWQHLQRSGPTSMAQLTKEIDAPRDLVMQSVGWLAREDKVMIDESSRRKIVTLRNGE